MVATCEDLSLGRLKSYQLPTIAAMGRNGTQSMACRPFGIFFFASIGPFAAIHILKSEPDLWWWNIEDFLIRDRKT